MRTGLKIFLFLVAVLTVVAVPAVFLPCSDFAAEMITPDIDTILERHRQALGGDALGELHSLRLEGIYAYNGLEHPLVEIRARPNLLRQEIDGLQPYGTQRAEGERVVRAHGPDGTWMRSGDEIADMKESTAPAFAAAADFDGVLVDAAKKGHQVELVGRDEIDGAPAFHLRVTLADGHEEEWWLGTVSHLPLRRAIARGEDFVAPHTWYYDDWREVAGIQVPFYVMAEEAIFAREHVYEKAEANVEIEAALFKRPE